MLQNAYFLAKIGADTAENEQHFAEILPIGRRVADRCWAAAPPSQFASRHDGVNAQRWGPHGSTLRSSLCCSNSKLEHNMSKT